MAILIDPPVSPFSDPKEIRLWIRRCYAELDATTDTHDRAAWEQAAQTAERWLDYSEE